MSASSLILEALPDPERTWVAAATVPTRLEYREVLAEAGEEAGALWLLVDAVAARIAVHRCGTEQEAGLNGPGSLACAFALIGSGISPWRIEVRRPGAALRLDASRLPELGWRAPSLKEIAENTAALETGQMAADFAQRNCRSARICVARRLIDYFETYGEPLLEVTHKQLSELLSLRRATVTLALQELEAARAIRARRGAIELVNPRVLAELSQQCGEMSRSAPRASGSRHQ